ncbi:phosphonate ABC transporter, permease protein PhnE [Isoptericola sp. b441]|uniref:Phosphonate ABC transporter, permease protein PhnE n=1 Tax=Actinotalea lenta TaxID=3064654 RepID=A0ABT9D9X3_9CELL|nr:MULTISPECIES: phosphonate ABC transporter, permease protein PhnE [unclassified Isoptericola]MDO8107704.1 phosphonate ABC transporter, permease protein PhnE [Isoptericola sp. b441]MDO8120625.1 phosphonate ABC transporter, permease protein PhnE [Isoptericola sp. b490]
MTELRIPPRPRAWPRVAVIVVVLIAITVITTLPALGGVHIDLGAIARNWANGSERIAKLFHPDPSILPRTWKPLLETLEMAVVGAALSALLALPLSLWAARPSNPTRSRAGVRAVLNVVRAVPDLVYATILVAMVGVGALPGVITLVLFDLGIVVKLVSEAIDSADASYMEAGHAAGGTQTQINRLTALPQTWPVYASQVLYSLELNVRVSSILGLVGAGGLGRLIDEVRGFYRYGALSMIILEILVVVIAIEVASNYLRKRLR